MKFVKPLVMAVTGWLTGTAVVAYWQLTPAQQDLARVHAIVALGEAQKDLMRKEGADLAAACAGKLTPQGKFALAGYTLKDGTWEPQVHGMLVAASHRRPRDLVFEAAATFYNPRFGQLFQNSLNPVDWKRRLEWAKPDPSFEHTKYLAVSAVWDLEVASSLEDGKFEPGQARYFTRVLSFPEGKVLCEGSSNLRMKGRIAGSGRAKTKELAQLDADLSVMRLVPFVWGRSVVATPLADLCALAGDESLCVTAAEETGPRSMTNRP